MIRTVYSHSTCWLAAFWRGAAILLSLTCGSAEASDEKRIAFDFFAMAPPLGWREQSMGAQGAYFYQQLPMPTTSGGCGLGIGSAFKSAGSLKTDLAAYEYHSLPGNFNAEPPKFEKLKGDWETVTRVYRNRYSPAIHKLVVMASRGGLTQSMTWDLTGSQICNESVRASLDTLTLLSAKQRIRSDGTQLAIVEWMPEREPTTSEKSDHIKYTSNCKAPSTTCIAPRIARVGSGCTCQNYRGLLEMGTIMP